jgi:putative PIN family toxin of toxin-antitoxin system
MKIVMDTCVLVAGLRSRLGASSALLGMIADGEIPLVASPALFLEYEAVLKREKHGLPGHFVDGFLTELALCIHPVEIWYKWRPQLFDEGDEMVLEAAINGQAEVIVTHNRKHFVPASVRFGIDVLTPAEVLVGLKRKGGQG